ncbi:M48 family metallopeptidase [Parachryseolinea silvisoli]|jgi:predicted Zn-dependent protease|uniref:M48 family metallopeptidase n=1 Tax=Parachryseolinea silvisoli TaxID=2873601 RepID=UPI002265D91F|nr:M48 family metallopeptidase [Parachryseolinea silvisoli]MCD9014041.1 M48 family metallopeptidase [Parachryseolinea silvisoli]
MEKVLIQFAVLVISFFGLWFLLSRIEFINRDRVDKFAAESEQKLGEIILESITLTSEEVHNKKLQAVLDSIKTRLCEGKHLDCSKIKVHLVRNSEVNAFALPDDHLVVFTGLLEYAEKPEEVAGVMAHEIGHIEKNHVMKKLTKDIGLSMLFAIAGGEAGGEIARETARMLSSTAFDRDKEREADAFAVETLAAANIDPQHLSNFFFRLARKHDMPEELVWISTHPDTDERAGEIIKLKKNYTLEPEPILGTDWKEIQRLVSSYEEDENEDDLRGYDSEADSVVDMTEEVGADTTVVQ